MTRTDPLPAPEVPDTRVRPLQRVLELLEDASEIVLTTHVNADGDGAGSQAALAAWLETRGKRATIVNPTPFPDMFRYLVGEGVIADPGGDLAAAALERADLFVVLDTSEPRRLGRIARAFGDRDVVILDHHPPAVDGGIRGVGVQDTHACATGELVYDLLRLASPGGATWPHSIAEGVYVAILTDTGSFRFANTTPRTHLLAADLIARGVDPEAVYRRVYASVPLRRIHLLRAALERLEVDPDLPISWITIPAAVVDRLGTTSDDLEGIVDHARSVEGTEVAILFRETSDGATKVSLRSNGRVDVNAIARRFGGGGHVKAAGALVGRSLDAVCDDVLAAVRAEVRSLESAG